MKALRAACSALLVVLCVLVPAAPAWAHAALLESTPADGAILASQPAEIVLRFSEGVATGLGAVKVVAPDGERADTGEVSTREGGKEVVAPLRDGLAEGTYVLLWRVVSGDSHPVSGASTFSVGRESETAHAHEGDDEPAGAAERLLPLSKLLLLTGLVLLVGGGAFVVALWPAGIVLPRVRGVLWSGWAMAVAGTAAGFLLQGPYAAGLPLSRALDGALLREVAATRLGEASLVRFGLLVVAAGVLLAAGRFRRRAVAIIGVPVAFGLLVTTSMTGHAAAGDATWLSVPADALHLAGASAWAGGLFVLAGFVLRGPAEALRGVLTGWSRWAATAVAVLVATGLYASWREVRELSALTSTDYGRLLIVKTAVVAVMLALGAVGRSWVRRRYAVPPVLVEGLSVTGIREPAADHAGASAAGLRRSVAVEAALAAVVLGVTAFLVGTTPARSAYAPLFTQTQQVTANLRVQVDVEPARAGLNDMHVYYQGPGGKALDVAEASARWTRDGTTDAVPVELPRKTLGHYERLRVPLPSAGQWTLSLITRTSDIDSHTTRFTVRVR